MKLGYLLIIASGSYQLWVVGTAIFLAISGWSVNVYVISYSSTIGLPFLIWGITRIMRNKKKEAHNG